MGGGPGGAIIVQVRGGHYSPRTVPAWIVFWIPTELHASLAYFNYITIILFYNSVSAKLDYQIEQIRVIFNYLKL